MHSSLVRLSIVSLKTKPFRDKAKIATNYLRSWFCVDLASTIPWGQLANALAGGEGSHQTAQMATLTKIVKFVRLLRLMRMPSHGSAA